MNTPISPAAQATSPDKNNSKYIAPCAVAALVWLVLSIYIFWVVPVQLELRDQSLKPEILRAALPAPMRVAMYFHEVYGTAVVSVLGLMGCGLAYIRRNAKLANWMIALGAVCLAGLIWAVLSNWQHR